MFLFDSFSHDLRWKVSRSLLSLVWDCISTTWHVNVLAHVTLFHCPRHRVSYYFPHSFCTLAFYESVSAQSDSPPAWRLTFPVKEPYCWFLIPLHPPLYKTMVSIASTEYIYSSKWETDWPGLLASLPAVLPGSQANLAIPSDSFVLPTDSSSVICANIISVAWGPWSWLHHHLVSAQIMACVYIYFPVETVEQTGGFDTPPSPTFLMNGLHSIFLHFPQDTGINFDRWYVLSLKQWSWAHCHWKLDSHTHPCAACLFSISPFLFVLLFPVALSQPALRDMLLIFLLELHCTAELPG